ncbi:MAG: winged helix-turn-helix domain-containing protein [archaeon]
MVTLLKEAETILRKNKKSMTAKQIYSEIMKRGKITFKSATPISSLSSRLYLDIMKNKNKSKFIKEDKLSSVYKRERHYSLRN